MSSAINDGGPLSEPNLQEVGAVALDELAPRSDWSGVCEHVHSVQFYESDPFLLDSLAGFISTGLELGEAVIVVATESHREALARRLEAAGMDITAVMASGQYLALDAQETLSKLKVNGALDYKVFANLIGGIIERAGAAHKRVRIFGEMVALLWAEGRQDEAMLLEGFWNELHKTQRFSLLCGYPMSGFSEETLCGPLGEVCATHSHVIPAESYTALGDADERLRAIILLQQKARLLEAEVAERKEAEATLRALKEELEVHLVREQMARAEAESANRLKDEFLATVSHELRTPLTAILGWSHMLGKKRLDDGSAERAVKIIERNARMQAQLVEDLLDVSRVITGKLRLSVGPVDAAAVINAAIDSVQLAADSKNIQLEVTLDPKARHIQGDASRLQQVVWNLLSNSIKFTPAGGHVRVRLERSADYVQIKVSDTGIGVSRDFLPFIFDRFRQADGSTTRKYGGLGLGLAIVRHLVELHGGTAHVESSGEGLGATFIIRLPLVVRQERDESGAGLERELPRQERSPRPLPSLEGVRVLLVDDDRDTLGLLSVILAECRATVQSASSAVEALEVFGWYRPHVLVSELAMPGEDGYSLIGKVRALPAADGGGQTQAVALTAYARIEDRMRALSAGFNMFVPKPVEPGELITIIASLADTTTTDGF